MLVIYLLHTILSFMEVSFYLLQQQVTVTKDFINRFHPSGATNIREKCRWWTTINHFKRC
jgi:hypothetical protein